MKIDLRYTLRPKFAEKTRLDLRLKSFGVALIKLGSYDGTPNTMQNLAFLILFSSDFSFEVLN